MHAKLAPLLLLLAVAPAAANDWPRKRGPGGQGHSAERDLPLRWAADANVTWKTPVPGTGWSSPIVWGDAVFVTTARGVTAHVVCLDRRSGAVRWDRDVFAMTPGRMERKNSLATPTPCTDGVRVYAAFGDGGAAALTFAGDVVWTNRDVRFYSRHGLGASPVVHDGLVLMPYDGSNGDFTPAAGPPGAAEQVGWKTPWEQAELAALDAKTGRRAWTGKRGPSRIAHVTPVVLDGGTQVISCAGDVIQGFDPKTGVRVWTAFSQGEGVTPSPAAGDGLLFTSSGFEATTLRAVRLGGTGDVTATHVAWEQRKGAPTQPSLLYVSPYLYAVSDAGVVTCYRGATGEVVHQERLGGTFSASPVSADGRIYLLNEVGETTVLAAGPTFAVLARNPLGAKCQASLAVARGQLFLRTEKHVYCVGPARD